MPKTKVNGVGEELQHWTESVLIWRFVGALASLKYSADFSFHRWS